MNSKIISSKKIIDSINKIDLEDSKKRFGQVFTPKWIADLMVFLSIDSGKEKCLDPSSINHFKFINKDDCDKFI